MQGTFSPGSGFCFAFLRSVKITATIRIATVAWKFKGMPGSVPQVLNMPHPICWALEEAFVST